MSLSFSEIRKRLEVKHNECIVKNKKTLNKENCKVRNLPTDAIVMDLDKEGLPFDRNQPRCDYLVFVSKNNNIDGYVIELKSGEWEISKVNKQLQSGATFVQELKDNKQNCINLVAVVFGRRCKSQRKELKGKQMAQDKRYFIKYFGKLLLIKRKACGNNLI